MSEHNKECADGKCHDKAIRYGRADWRCKDCGRSLMLEMVLMADAQQEKQQEYIFIDESGLVPESAWAELKKRKQDWEEQPWAALLTSFQKEGIRTEIAKAREKERNKAQLMALNATLEGDTRLTYELGKSKARTEVLQKIEEWAKTEGFASPSEAGQFSMHSDGYNQALEDLLTFINSLK